MAHKVLQLRRDTAANWVTNNPILASAEAGIETDTYRMKIGDGTTVWNNLGYFGETDSNAIHDDIAGEIAAVAEKETPADADVLLIEDSADSNNKKKVQIANLPAGNGGNGFTSRCRVELSSAQTISTDTWTKIRFNSEIYDDNNEFNNAVNYRFTCKIAGYYHFNAGCGILNLTDTTLFLLHVYLNNSPICAQSERTGKTGAANCTVAGDIKLNVDDYLEVFIYHATPADRNTDHTYGNPYFCVHRFA